MQMLAGLRFAEQRKDRKMKILSWNCNMAFRIKYESVCQFQPDIMVIQECEDKILLHEIKEKLNYSDICWFGKNKNKGIAIITFGKYRIMKLDHDQEYEYILPVKICDESISFNLLAIWTQMKNKNIYDSYVVQATRAFLKYHELLKDKNIVIIGDFNSNAIWDNESPKEYTHSEMIELLKEKQINSVYHVFYNENYGKETTPTLYFQRNISKPYHIDYCFLKQNIVQKVKKFEIGK